VILTGGMDVVSIAANLNVGTSRLDDASGVALAAAVPAAGANDEPHVVSLCAAGGTHMPLELARVGLDMQAVRSVPRDKQKETDAKENSYDGSADGAERDEVGQGSKISLRHRDHGLTRGRIVRCHLQKRTLSTRIR
jgi:hypothetical protein